MRASILKHRPRILPTLLLNAALVASPCLAFAQAGPGTPPAAAPRGGPKSATPSPPAVPKVPAATETAALGQQPTGPSEADRQTATQALVKGQEAYAAGDYLTAAAHFDASLHLAPSPGAALGRAMALDLQGKAGDAIAAFEALFSDPDHTALPSEQLEPARQRLEVLKRIPASVTLHVSPPSADLKLDGVPQKGPSPFSLSLGAGAHQVELSGEGLVTANIELKVQAAQTLEQAIELKADARPPAAARAAQPAPVAPPPRAPRSLVPAYVTLGVAGAGAIVGTIFGLQSLAAKSDFDRQRTAAAADDVERNALIADMAFGIAITVGITGVVLLTSDEPAERSTAFTKRDQPSAFARVEFSPYVSPTGAGAAARATF